MIVRCRVGTEHQPVQAGRILQAVEDAAWLDARGPRDGVDLDDAMEMAREVDANRDVAPLPRQARTSAAREDRRIMLTADADGLHDFSS